MTEGQAFKKATDWIKFHKKIKLGEICSQLGIERSKFDNIRRQQVKPESILIESLITLYPEVAAYFTETTEDVKQVDNYFSRLLDSLEETKQAQEELIQLLKDKIKALEEENNRLKGKDDGGQIRYIDETSTH